MYDFSEFHIGKYYILELFVDGISVIYRTFKKKNLAILRSVGVYVSTSVGTTGISVDTIRAVRKR